MLIAALVACGAIESAPPIAPPATKPAAHVYVADPSVPAVGTFAMKRHRFESGYPTMEIYYSNLDEQTGSVELRDDGTARLCAGSKRETHSSVSKYASASGQDEHDESSDSNRIGRSGPFTVVDGAIAIQLVNEARDCDWSEEYPRDNQSLTCSLGKLDGHEVIACPASHLVGGESAALDLGVGSPMIYLARGELTVSLTVEGDRHAPADGSIDQWTFTWSP